MRVLIYCYILKEMALASRRSIEKLDKLKRSASPETYGRAKRMFFETAENAKRSL